MKIVLEFVGGACHAVSGSNEHFEVTTMAKIHTGRDSIRIARRCRRCTGWLHAPGSVALRLGPTCRGHVLAERRARAAAMQLTMFDLPTAREVA